MFKTSLTQQNLFKAFIGESMARNKYTTFAKVARKQDYEWVARIFEETADNERAHAQELFEQIKGKVEVTNTFDIKPFSSILDNLKMAAEGERYEWTEMYPSFEKVAITEKQSESVRLFREIKEVEEKHEERYVILAKKIENDTLYSADKELEWKCLNCGYIHKGKLPPKKCPVCQKPFTWYMALGLVR